MSNESAKKGGLLVLRVIKGFFSLIGRTLATLVMVGIITGCIVASVLTVYILNYIGADEELDLDEIKLGYTSIIYAYDKNGKPFELQKLYFSDNNRIWVDLDEMSEYATEAVKAIEDKRFDEHQGVDWRRTFGAFLNMFSPGISKGGGSTITQQLIKNVTQDDDLRVDRKVREIFRALNLEQRYSKERILETYLNVVPFGAGTNGIESAALTYFGKSAKDLDLAEAAAIVGITQKPTAYNPFLYPEANEERRQHVLFEMLDQGRITQAEYDKAVNQTLNFRREEYESRNTEIQSYFVDHVINQVLEDLQTKKGMTPSYAFDQLYRGGYRIYTTVDVEMQEYLENFYLNSDGFPAILNQEYPQSACTITDINGKMLAVVGGIGTKSANRVLNRATMSKRQPGSSLKPIGPYAVAFEYNHVRWSSIYEDSPINLASAGQPDKLWPSNYYAGNLGPVTIVHALQRSINTVPAKIIQAIGPQSVYDFLHDRLNFHSLVDSAVIDGRVYSDIALAPMTLGALTYGVTPLEMAGGYQIYANGGTFTTPYCYTKVEDSNGRTILEADTTPVRVISEETSVVVNKILQLVVSQAPGTGTTASLGQLMPVAGKTGTSEHDVDQWFIGMTPYYVCQVWLGYDRTTRTNEYGATVHNTIGYYNYPPPILWKTIMEPLQQGLDYKQFPESDKVVSKTYCALSGNLAGPNCTAVATGWYKTTGNGLPPTCSGHVVRAEDGENAGSVSSGSSGSSNASGASSGGSDNGGDQPQSSGRTVENNDM